MPDTPKSLTQDAAEAVETIVRKASPLSIGIAVVLAVLIGGSGMVFYINRETIVKLFETAKEVDHLHMEHDHCQTELAALKLRVTANETEIRELRAKLTAAN